MARKKVATGKKKSIGWYLDHDWQLWVLLLPAIIYIFIFCYVPMYGVQLAFRDYKPNSSAEMEENCSDNGLYSILYFNGCYGFYLKYYVSKQGWRNQ